MTPLTKDPPLLRRRVSSVPRTFLNTPRTCRELQQLRDAGCDDVLLFPCAADLDQPGRLAVALDAPTREG
jgi:hypothetical protein